MENPTTRQQGNSADIILEAAKLAETRMGTSPGKQQELQQRDIIHSSNGTRFVPQGNNAPSSFLSQEHQQHQTIMQERGQLQGQHPQGPGEAQQPIPRQGIQNHQAWGQNVQQKEAEN